MSKNWSSTLRLPKSTFLPRPSVQARPDYIRRCADDLYKWQADNRPAANPFILHDGPPYANGALHVGHALNKILKDIILRVKVQQGRRVTYVPGWDCHGLPIELKALEKLGEKRLNAVGIRKAARALATKTVSAQMKSFRNYGVMADWEHRWTTMDPVFTIKQLRLFQQLVRGGLIYRKYKPVYWSPSSHTALAEAELEYKEDHISTAAFVRFPIVEGWDRGLPLNGFEGNLYAVIWTTTPWTLPANKAIAVHDNLNYSVVSTSNGDALIVASNCLGAVNTALGGQDWTKIASVKGSQLRSLRYVNVLQGRNASPQSIIHADFVSAESGSGLVHCAPGHGLEDYEATRLLEIVVTAPVDEDGLFTKDAYPDEPERLASLSVLEDGSSVVLSLLGPHVLNVHKYKHKYPYDWRTKKPVIVRATAQWFADVASIKNPALKALEEVRFIPESGRNRLEAFVKGRSEWCISRQRAWGVPIPALYDPNGDAVMNDEIIEHIIGVINEREVDAWWSDDATDSAWVPPTLRGDVSYSRGTDTMDVWFDSGSSWTQTDDQADVYLEGTDQHRGWFQSSLLTRVAAMAIESSGPNSTQVGLSPFKTLVTHGFTLDQDGRKMSKSIGNIISPDQVMDGSLLPPLKMKKKASQALNPADQHEALGPDALRLWAASSDYSKDVVLGQPVLQAVHQSLIKYRIIIKMLLGSMHESARTARLTTLDHIALIQLKDVMEEVADLNNKFDFHKSVAAINRWVAADLSAFYLEALKDRLYCADGGGVLEPIFFGFLRMLAPVTPLLVVEAWDHAPGWLKADSAIDHPLHQIYDSPVIDPSRLTCNEAQVRDAIPVLMTAHAAIKVASERARAEKVLGSSLQCAVYIELPDGKALAHLKGLEGDLEDMFVVSSVALNETIPRADWSFSEGFEVGGEKGLAWVLPPKKSKCPRCWRYVAEKQDELCGRCEEVVSKT